MAKSHVRFPENEAPHWWPVAGRAIAYVQQQVGLDDNQFAEELGGKDPSQVRRWKDAKERPQIETVFAVKRFSSLLVEGLARQITDGSVEVVTEIRVRRPA